MLGFLTGRHQPGGHYTGMRALPATAAPPQPFLLGASGSTAEFAAQAGIGFTFAHFINPTTRGARACEIYRQAFRAGDFSAAPSVVVAVFVAVGESDAEAEAYAYADAFHLWLSHAESAHLFDRVPSLDTTRAHRWTTEEIAVRERNAEQLRALGEAYGTDEVMINLMMPNERVRLQALDALATAAEALQ